MYRRSSRQGGAKGGEPVVGKTLREVAQVEARDIVDWVSRLVAEGDVRRITLRQGDRVLLDLPLRRGVATAVLDRTAAVAGIAGRVARCTIEVERAGDAPVEDEPPLHAHIVQ
jgi:hypothetical protein